MTEVEVALVGRNLIGTAIREITPAWNEGFWDGENERLWDERQRVTLTARDDETLREIFSRAIDAFGIYEADWSDWKPDPNDPARDPGVRTRRFTALRYDASPLPLIERLSVTLTIPDEEGRAAWSRWHYDVTYQELVHAASAGSVPGNPRQIYLCVRPDAAGGGILHEWSLLVQAWAVAFGVIGTLAALNDAHDLYLKIRRRLAGHDVVRRKTEDWLRRNGHADMLEYMLRGEPWSAFQLAALLGCTTDEAEDILALYGYERSEDENIWVYVAGNEELDLPVKDVAAHALVAFTKEVQRRYLDAIEAPPEEIEALFREIVRQADRGRVGSLAHIRYRNLLDWRPPSRRSHVAQVFRRFIGRR